MADLVLKDGAEEETESLFGEGDYGPDKVNRLVPGSLDFDKNSPEVPSEIREIAQTCNNLSHDIRRSVRIAFRPDVLTEVPSDIVSVDDFFERVKSISARIWRCSDGSDGVSGKISANAEKWIVALRANIEEDPESASTIEPMIKVLEDPYSLDEKVHMRQLGILEGMREIDLGIWEQLLVLAAERQHTELMLAHRWVKKLPNETLSRLGVSREELQLLVRLSNFTNHFINMAYIKQMEKAEQTGGTSVTPLDGVSGIDRLYDLAEGIDNLEDAAEAGTYKAQTYAEAFPIEIKRIGRNLERIADLVDRWMKEGKLSEKYNGLSAYLRLMSEAYVSAETRPSQVADLWNKVIQSSYDLAKKGCPVIVIPPNTPAVASDANKMDVELRVATSFNPPEGLTELFGQMGDQVRDFNNFHRGLLSEDPTQVEVALYSLPNGASGPNLFYETPAESGDVVWHHYNTIAAVARNNEIKYVQGLLRGESIDVEEQVKGSYVEVAIHELGHTRLPYTDENVAKRIGSGNEKEVIEELKAETQGMRNFLELYASKGEPISMDIVRRQLLAKLGVQCDAIDNKTSDPGSFGERYHMPALVIIKALLDNKTLVFDEDSDSYVITDYKRGLQVVAEIGDMLVDRFYGNAKCTPQDVVNYVKNEVRPLANDPAINQFKRVLSIAKRKAAL